MTASRDAEVRGSAPLRRIPALLARAAAVAAALAAASAIALAPASSASAHDYLVSSTPAANSTVTSAVADVTLRFDDIVLNDGGHGALVQVTDTSGRNFESDCATIQGRDVTVPVALGAAGSYRVTWQIVSADGHPVSDSIQFTYHGPAQGEGRAGPLAKCGTSVQAPAAGATSAPASAAGASGPQASTVIVIVAVAGGVVLLAIVAVAVVLIVGARRRHA